MIKPRSEFSRHIKSLGWLAIVVSMVGVGLYGSAAAQTVADDTGQRLYLTSCGLCHAAPDLVNKAPGPALNRTTLDGKSEDIAAFIKTGTNNMPSFRYTYSDAEIDAIARYISGLPAETTK
jgi:mono/diheme cytochrome c family protein